MQTCSVLCPLLVPYCFHSPSGWPTSRPTNLNKYFDKHDKYWHVILPREFSKQVPKTYLMSKEKWRRPGVHESRLGSLHNS
ncbi:unnamed protein product [Nyctereutes procyonoides]|uniref:(raccoon dog) hypothetical protein n=1 Tax=Nyctereutes procyonoides TaxID=34880 RepID=A0A811ZWI1_NYCPR|nr:unnamed protein product [Nyctereutes procyonoides]